MEYKAVLRQYGNSVEIELDATDAKDALYQAHVQADAIYGYKGIGDQPTVSVKPVPIKEEK